MKSLDSINNKVSAVRRLLDEHSPVVLTGMALVGLGATAYYTYKGTQKGTRIIEAEEIRRNMVIDNPDNGQSELVALTNQEKFLLTYKFYAPAGIAFVGTGVCMIMATKIGLNRTAALGAALVVAERGNEQYRDKVKEILGETKHTKVEDAVAADNVAKMGYIAPPREGEQTFVDAWTGRPISTTMEKMEKTLNEFNKELLYNRFMSLNEFYDHFEMDNIQSGSSLGWNIGDGRDDFVELMYTTVLKDERAVVVFKFNRIPMPKFRDKLDDV